MTKVRGVVAATFLVIAVRATGQVPYAFTPGTPASATEVNANFSYLEAAVAAVQPWLVDATVTSPSLTWLTDLQTIYSPGVGGGPYAISSRPGTLPALLGCLYQTPAATCGMSPAPVGIVFTLPRPALVQVCFQFPVNQVVNPGGNIRGQFYLAETYPSNDGDVIRNGSTRAPVGVDATTVSSPLPVTTTSINLCDTFDFTSPGQKQIVLKCDRNTDNGAFQVGWTRVLAWPVVQH